MINKLILIYTDVTTNQRARLVVTSAGFENEPVVSYEHETWTAYNEAQAARVAAWLLKCKRASWK